MLLKQINGSLWLYRCDWCLKEFERKHVSTSKAKTHGCSRSCSSKASRVTVKANLMEKFGVENVSQLPEVREKVKRTTFERYGVECSFQSEDVKAKCRETLMETLGVDHPTKSPIIKQRVKDTFTKNWGVDHPWKTEKGQELRKETMLEKHGVDNPRKSDVIRREMLERHVENYGVENPLQRPEIISQIKQTNRENHGVDWGFQREDVKAKSRQTSLKRYGVEHPMQHPDIQRKAVMACFTKGKGFVSKLELECLDALVSIYGDVIHQVSMNGWLIDFHIVHLDVYVQFDGVYWHGLNRSFERIQNPRSKRDSDIAKKWFRDREQEQWFLENGLTLVRVTDEEFSKDNIQFLIESKANTN